MEFTAKESHWTRTTGASIIHYYAKKGYTEDVLKLLETENDADCEASLFEKSRSGLTILHYSAIYGRTKTAEEILHKADSFGLFHRLMSCRSHNGSTPLHCAFESGRIRTAIRLIELGGARYLSIVDNEDHQPLEVCDRRVRVSVEEEVKRALRSYYYWGRRRGFILLLAQLKRNKARYEESWKYLHFDEHAISYENLLKIDQQSSNRHDKKMKKHQKFIGLRKGSRNDKGNKNLSEISRLQRNGSTTHFYHQDELSCPRQIFGQARVRGIIAENYYRYRAAGYANEQSYKTDSRGFAMWGNPSFWDNKNPFDNDREGHSARSAREDLSASIFHMGSGNDCFIRALKHICIGNMKPHHPQKGRSGGIGDVNLRDYLLSSEGLAGKRSLHLFEEGLEKNGKKDGEEPGITREEDRAARRRHTIFKPHLTHQASWKKIQEMYHDDKWWDDDVKMVRRLRHAQTGYLCYFRKEKEFLFKHKGVDPKEILMAYVLLREDVCSKIASYL